METIYLRAEEEIRRRRQKLNLLRGVRWGLTVSLSLTVLYGLTWALGLWGPQPPSGWPLLLLGNALGAGLGALWGRRLPTPLAEDLYRVDRALRLDEKLITIYELRRSGDPRLLPALYRQLDRRRGRLGEEGIRRALAPPPSERRAWLATGGLALLSFGFVSLWLAGLAPISWEGLGGASPPGIVRTPGSLPPDAPKALPPNGDGEDSTAARKTSTAGEPLTDEARKSLCRKDRTATSSLTEEQRSELCEGQEGSGPPGEAAASETPAQAPGVEQTLSQLLDRLLSGEVSADQVRSQLESLAKETPPGELREALERAAQAATEQELRERIQETLSQLAQRPQPSSGSEAEPTSQDPTQAQAPAGASEPSSEAGPPDETADAQANSASSEGDAGSSEASSADAGESAQDAGAEDGGEPEPSEASAGQGDSTASETASGTEDSQAPSSEGSEESASSTTGESSSDEGAGQEASSQGEGPSAEAADSGSDGSAQAAEGEGNEAPKPSPQDGDSASSKPTEAKTEGDGGDRSSGSGIGTEGGSDASENPASPWTSLPDGLLIQGGALPRNAELLNRLFAKGLPVDLAGQGPDGTPRVVLNLARFESLLEARELPPELRALVRAYFLAIAEGPGPDADR